MSDNYQPIKKHRDKMSYFDHVDANADNLEDAEDAKRSFRLFVESGIKSVHVIASEYAPFEQLAV